MGMTITEKILAKHAGLKEVQPGMLINAKVDIAMGHDVTAPIAIAEFKKAGGHKVFDRNRVVIVPDHFTPNKDIQSAQNSKILRDFAREHKLSHYYEGGQIGVCHVLLPEQGIVVPGDLVIGADSHTCTYGALGAFATGVGSTDLAAVMLTGELWFKVPETMKIVFRGKRNPWVTGKDLILHVIGQIGVDGATYRAMEFTGETVRDLTMADRFTIANMVVEAGAKNGIFIPDEITRDYVQYRAEREFTFYDSDPDAAYASVLEIDVSRIEPQVAFPSSALECPGDQPGRVHQDRPGLYRLLHQRPHRGSAHRRPHSEKQDGGPLCAPDHHSRDAGDLPDGDDGRPVRDFS